MGSHTTPNLARPGAGLPKVELLLSRFFFKLFRSNARMRTLRSKLHSERLLIKNLLGKFSVDQKTKQILIPRILGIEDSSRYWSGWMVLEHLVITTEGMMTIAHDLESNRLPGRAVRIEDVKPRIDVSPDIEERFWNCFEKLEKYLQGPRKKSSLTHDHPWFGPLDAHGWTCLTVLHMGIHRRQLAMINAFCKKFR